MSSEKPDQPVSTKVEEGELCGEILSLAEHKTAYLDMSCRSELMKPPSFVDQPTVCLVCSPDLSNEASSIQKMSRLCRSLRSMLQKQVNNNTLGLQSPVQRAKQLSCRPVSVCNFGPRLLTFLFQLIRHVLFVFAAPKQTPCLS